MVTIKFYDSDRHFNKRNNKTRMKKLLEKYIKDSRYITDKKSFKRYKEDGENIILFLIGGGYVGSVYGIEGDDDIFAIKKQDCDGDYDAEIDALIKANKVDSMYLPMLYATVKDYNDCYLIMEMANDTLKQLTWKPTKFLGKNGGCEGNKEFYISILQQAILALNNFHQTGLYHDDPHEENYLFRVIDPNPSTFDDYIGKRTVSVNNCGFLLKLFDFGTAKKITSKLDIVHDYWGMIQRFSNIMSSYYLNPLDRYITNIKNKLSEENSKRKTKTKNLKEYSDTIATHLFSLLK